MQLKLQFAIFLLDYLLFCYHRSVDYIIVIEPMTVCGRRAMPGDSDADANGEGDSVATAADKLMCTTSLFRHNNNKQVGTTLVIIRRGANYLP